MSTLHEGLGVDEWARRGIAGRAIMLDAVAQRARQGRPIDRAQDDKITVADLGATRVAAGIQFQPGDVWLIRSGWVGWYEQQSQATREALAADIGRHRHPAQRIVHEVNRSPELGYPEPR